MMSVGSVFAGIGGFDLGFERAGFRSAWRCEIEPFCRKVLTAKLPGPTIYGDVRDIGKSTASRVDVLVGGFPCQDLSVAGRRGGLSSDRSGLFFQFVRLIHELQPRWWVIENVPGLFSSPIGFSGRDFAIALATLDACGQVGVWRVLDSQYFGLAQRRKRVFLVGGPRGIGERAQAVLFDSERCRWDSATGHKARARLAATLRGRSARAGVHGPGRGGEDDTNLIAYALRENNRNTSQGPANYIAGPLGGGNNGTGRRTEDDPNLVLYDTLAHALKTTHTRTGRLDPNGETFMASPITASAGHHGHSSPRGDGQDNLVAVVAFDTTQITSRENRCNPQFGDPCHPLAATAHAPAIADTLRSDPGGTRQGHNTTYPCGVRRLTPLECERVQGFPDGFTCLCGEGHRGSQFCRCKDSPRYKALGNAVSVPVSEWIAKRIIEAEVS